MADPVEERAQVLAKDADYVDGVRCVVMPCCAFTFDAVHTDDKVEPPRYTCPQCARPSPPTDLTPAQAKILLALVNKWAEGVVARIGDGLLADHAKIVEEVETTAETVQGLRTVLSRLAEAGEDG